MSIFTKTVRVAALGPAGLATQQLPAIAGSCHAHAHSHDQCGWHTRSRTKSGGSVWCDANTNTPGVHSHAFSTAECFLFSCNKVVGGHHVLKSLELGQQEATEDRGP